VRHNAKTEDVASGAHAAIVNRDSRADVLAVVFGPDGSTVVRRDDTGEDAWSALWNGDEAHDVQATGMLSAIVAPLAACGVPVWVVSSHDGDLVLGGQVL
jgi:hypothetical protein